METFSQIRAILVVERTGWPTASSGVDIWTQDESVTDAFRSERVFNILFTGSATLQMLWIYYKDGCWMITFHSLVLKLRCFGMGSIFSAELKHWMQNLQVTILSCFKVTKDKKKKKCSSCKFDQPVTVWFMSALIVTNAQTDSASPRSPGSFTSVLLILQPICWHRFDQSSKNWYKQTSRRQSVSLGSLLVTQA